MLLAIDIGNTNIVVAVFSDDKVIAEWRIHSDSARTGDEYASILHSFFHQAGLEQKEINGGILSSVVPLLIGPFISLMEKIIGKKPILMGPAIYDRLPVQLPESAVNEIGTDLVANAVQAYTQFKQPCIVTDFGTALSFIAIDGNGKIHGVAIAPGIKTAVNSLFRNTAQLPSVPLEAPPDSLGKNTIHSIQSGIIFGYKGLVESMIARMKDDMSQAAGIDKDQIMVIATGGLNSVLKPLTKVFDQIDKRLTLNGLKTVYEILN
ncbi:MAG: type III pantothenate kinase [Treponemataceae bacterium]|nr:type III pantothenate kinase [Treponemataceae bacterium]